MPSAASSRPRATPAADAPAGRSPAHEPFPVPPDWIVKDPEEDRRRMLALIEQGERDIAAGREHDLEDVLAELEAT